MKNPEDIRSMNRRDFLKAGIAGAAVASIGLSGARSLLHAQVPTAPVLRTLGRTGLKVTVVSYGTMLTPEPEVIRAGIDMGINHLDTARRYLRGRSEEVVSKAVKGIRDKVYISTKSHAQSPEELTSDVETSLGELKTDRVEILYLHNLASPERAFRPEMRQGLLTLRKQGKIRFFGVSTHTNQAEVIDSVVSDPDKFFDVVLVGYNFKTDPSVKAAIANAAAAGVGVVAMKTQAGGYHTDAMGQMSPHQAALKWVLQDTNVAAAIPGMKTLEHLRELVPVMGMKMTGRDERLLRRYSEAVSPYYCTLCGACEKTCPRGVEISVVNRALMYADGYKEPGLARENFREASSAGLCAGCPECVAQCRNGLSIAEKMRRARTVFA